MAPDLEQPCVCGGGEHLAYAHRILASERRGARFLDRDRVAFGASFDFGGEILWQVRAHGGKTPGDGSRHRSEHNMNGQELRRSAAIAPIKGAFKTTPQDFEVEEVPAYEPSGEGPHLYLWVEERDASANWALRQIAKYFGVDKRDIGRAGLKDRQAVTRQYYSLPRHVVDESLLEELPIEVNAQIKVLRASAHQNKLRRGHLKGNLFGITIRLAEGEDLTSALERARQILALCSEQGVLNLYGEQRFGSEGDTGEQGFALLAGTADRDLLGKINRDRFLKRLVLNAAQSDLFNAVAFERQARGALTQVWEGDVLSKRESGGVFVCEDPVTDQARLDEGELVLAGPMFGPKMVQAGGQMGALEDEVLAARGLTLADFEKFPKLCSGTRRPLLVWPENVEVSALEDEHALRVRFFLPSGSYATIVLRELMSPTDGAEFEQSP
jgi:tRNA pseudouridine13 synthase